MGLGDCVRCVKYLLFIFNLIFCLIGLAILGVGVWLYVAPLDKYDFQGAEHIVRFTGLFFIIVGGIIGLLGFLGCCGAIFENRVLLILFFIILLLIFLVLLASGIVFLVLRDPTVEEIGRLFSTAIGKQNETESRNFTDVIQTKFHCCGWAKGEDDYRDHGFPVPDSCQPKPPKDKLTCKKRLNEDAKHYGVTIAIAIFVTAAVALVGLIFSMLLCCAITDMA